MLIDAIFLFDLSSLFTSQRTYTNSNKTSHHSIVLFTCINKDFHLDYLVLPGFEDYFKKL